MAIVICDNCGEALLPTGLCFDCGTQHRHFDVPSFALGAASLVMYILFAAAKHVLLPFFSLGVTAINIITLLSYLIPLSIAVDAIIIALKRRREHKVAVGLTLGIVSSSIGLILLLRYIIFIWHFTW